MACKHQKIVEYPMPLDAVFNTFVDAIPSTGLGTPHPDYQRHTIYVSVNMGLTSWGENIDISMQPTPAGTTAVSIKSESSMSLTLVDWGKNRKNVERIINAVNAHMPR